MTTLAEENSWEAGIYQLELTDPVVGGPDGISNLQAKQLANRTSWLKALLESAIGLLAPLESPAFTDTPSCPTPAQFDHDLTVVNSEFVQRALGNFQDQISKNTSSVLLASEAGSVINLIAGAVNTTLPLLSSVPKGASFTFICTGQNGASILRNGTDTMSANGAVQVSYAMNIGDTLTLVSAGTLWLAVSGTGRDKFQQGLASTLSATGVKRIPDASSPTGFFIIQWGFATSNGSGVGNVVLPLAFPNAHLRTLLTPRNTAAYNSSASVNSQTPSGFAFYTSTAVAGAVGTAQALGVEWLAIGY